MGDIRSLIDELSFNERELKRLLDRRARARKSGLATGQRYSDTAESELDKVTVANYRAKVRFLKKRIRKEKGAIMRKSKYPRGVVYV